MKIIGLLILALAFNGEAQARQTTLEFDLTGEVNMKNNRLLHLKIKNVNKKLKKKGLEGLPERVIVGKDPKAYWDVLIARIDAGNAAEVYKTAMHFTINSHDTHGNGYLYQYPEICYRGEAKDVRSIIDAMTGNFLHDEQGILALRWGKETDIRADHFTSAKALRKYYDQGYEVEVDEWIDFDKKSDDVLIMSDLGAQGDGSEVYATTISPCP